MMQRVQANTQVTGQRSMKHYTSKIWRIKHSGGSTMLQKLGPVRKAQLYNPTDTTNGRRI